MEGVIEDMAMEGMVDMVDMVDMDIMERDLLKLRLSQDTSEEVMDMEDMVMVAMEVMVIGVGIMERGRPKLSQDILEVMAVMVMVVDMEDMAMDVDTMARGRLKLSQDILEDMVDMDEDMDMEVMVMVGDMAIMVNLLFFNHHPHKLNVSNIPAVTDRIMPKL